jgi:hypothetical protein
VSLTFFVESTRQGVLEEAHEEVLGRILQRGCGRLLQPKAVAGSVQHLLHQADKGAGRHEAPPAAGGGGTLVLADLAQRDGARAAAVPARRGGRKRGAKGAGAGAVRFDESVFQV